MEITIDTNNTNNTNNTLKLAGFTEIDLNSDEESNKENSEESNYEYCNNSNNKVIIDFDNNKEYKINLNDKLSNNKIYNNYYNVNTEESFSELYKKKYIIYTDGSIINNGKRGKIRYGGIGIYFENNNIKNISSPLYGKLITNNICELDAAKVGIETIIKYKDYKESDLIEIYTDSEYMIMSITIWYNHWKNNNWMRNKNGKQVPVKNIDIIMKIRKLYDTYNIRFYHVKAHQIEPNKNSKKWKHWYGNDIADKLARNGTKKAIELYTTIN